MLCMRQPFDPKMIANADKEKSVDISPDYEYKIKFSTIFARVRDFLLLPGKSEYVSKINLERETRFFVLKSKQRFQEL